MGAISLRVRADLRRRWPAWLAVAALIGVFAGGVIAISAGAERTNTAYPRLLAATRAPDLLVVDRMPDPSIATFSPAQLAGLPQVSESGQLDSFVVLRPSDLNVLAPSDDVIGNRFYTRKLLAGRLPDPTRPDEVDVSFPGAEADHIRVGADLQLQLQPASGSTPVPVRLRVVGIEAAAGEFPPEAGPAVHTVSATPAFVRAYGAELATSPATLLRLTHGAADLPAVQSEIDRMAAGKPTEEFPLGTQGANTQRSIHLQSVALWVLALLLALAGILIVAQILARQSALESGGYRELRALGMTGRELWAVGLARVGLIGAAAAVVAGLSAAAASPIFPLGLARIAEPHPGFHLDAATVLFGHGRHLDGGDGVRAMADLANCSRCRTARPVEQGGAPSFTEYGRHPAAGGASVRRDRNRFRSGPDPRPVRRTGALDDHGGSHGRRRPHRRHRLFRQSHPPDEHPEAVRRHLGCTGDLSGG